MTADFPPPRRALLRRYASLFRADVAAAYTRDFHKWLIAAPLLGVVTGLLITVLVQIILRWLWPPLLRYDLAHPAAIIPSLAAGFLAAGLIMQHLTPDPDEHSTEEIIRAYHEHGGAVDMRPFVPKLLAAIATVGAGGSAALEGPSIYGGGAIGSWLWTRLRRLGLDARDRRIMLISGAAAGMSAVFRAPLTGIIFAIEMPYKDDLAHEALMPSLIASVVSYATMAAFLGSQPLFDFASTSGYTRRDLAWSALLGAVCGLVAMAFAIAFRRVRSWAVHAPRPHWAKMTAGGVLTGICGVVFVTLFHGDLIPLGPNYEAVTEILRTAHGSGELVVFGALKLLATLFSLGLGGVSAMFVPLFLTGGSLGTAFGQSIVHSAAPELYAAVGMAAFIAGGYKAPLTAVVFVAEATGGHAFIIPALIGAAVAYGVSGEASASGDQRLHESVRVAGLASLTVADVMQPAVVAAAADATLSEFTSHVAARRAHAVYPVVEHGQVAGALAVAAINAVPAADWGVRRVRDVMEREVRRVEPGCDAQEALRRLLVHDGLRMLCVVSAEDRLLGILTPIDVLRALDRLGPSEPAPPATP
jgi:chloride channel protein, CIC family